MSKDNLDELTDEDIDFVLQEKERRETERIKIEKEGFTKRPKIFAICPKCKSWFTEDDVRRYPVCPVCGNKDVTPV